MSDEEANLKNALVDAIVARKIVEAKLLQGKNDLSSWQKRLSEQDPAKPEADQIAQRIRRLEQTIAELEAEHMAQGDLEKNLRSTLSKLENTVSLVSMPDLSNLNRANDTMQRLEGQMLEKEELAKLGNKEYEDRKVAHEIEKKVESNKIDDELEALKQSLKKDKHAE